MPARAYAANPQVLIWARERSGLSILEVASRMSRDTSDIAAWESGEKAPTYNQLERLAEKIYRRPVALFFLPAPPHEEEIRSDFRTLPDLDLDALAADTRFALRDAMAFQESLRDLTGGQNPAERLITKDITATAGQAAAPLAAEVREYLGVSLDDQRAWSGTREAMGAWREVVESAGVFIFKRSFQQSAISGFCVTDDQFPVIVVNNSTSFTRQIFTVFHELAHLLYGISSITTVDMSFLDRLNGEAREVEVACNQFAAEFLVPVESFPWSIFDHDNWQTLVPDIASQYNVSREAVLRRLLDRGLIDHDAYAITVAEWGAEFPERSGSGGNYYATQATYLGRTFLKLAFSQYHAGNVTLADLSTHLRVKARNIPRLEEFVLA